MADLYAITKGRAFQYALLATGRSNFEAVSAGYKDVFDLLMFDSDHARQPAFLGLIMDMPEGHRQILLDGLAREYAGVEGWTAYVDRETKDA